MQKSNPLVGAVAALLVLLPSGCAMMGTHPMMGNDGTSSNRPMIYEGGDQTTSVRLEVPSLTAGVDSEARVRILDRVSMSPVTSAQVLVSFQRGTTEGGKAESHPLVESPREPGTYPLHIEPEQAGVQEFEVVVQRVDEAESPAAVTIRTSHPVAPSPHDSGGTTLWISGLVMGVMMAGMMLF